MSKLKRDAKSNVDDVFKKMKKDDVIHLLNTERDINREAHEEIGALENKLRMMDRNLRDARSEKDKAIDNLNMVENTVSEARNAIETLVSVHYDIDVSSIIYSGVVDKDDSDLMLRVLKHIYRVLKEPGRLSNL